MVTARSNVYFGWRGLAPPDRMASDDHFVRLWNDVGQLFSNVIRGTGLAELPQAAYIDFPVEVSDTRAELKIWVELPGVDETDVTIDLRGDLLTIRGEKKKAAEEIKETGCYITERRYGKLERTLRLPYTVDGDKTKARFSNGLLMITIPKPTTVQQQAKRIKVKAGA